MRRAASRARSGTSAATHLVPVPEVGSLAELNARIAVAEQAEDGRRIGARIRTIGQDFAAEVPLLVPVPDEPFETGLLLTPRESTATARSPCG